MGTVQIGSTEEAPSRRDEPISVYLPPEALQGEDVPSFALWKGLTFSEIEVAISDNLELKDVYNASKEDWVMEGTTLRVKRVEVNGYLGLLFRSRRSLSTKESAHVRFRFSVGPATFEEFALSSEFYRPLLSFDKTRSEFVVNPRQAAASAPIGISKTGDGTVLVWVSHRDRSDVVVEEAEDVRKFRTEVRKDLETSFKRLSKDFPRHESLLTRGRNVFSKLFGDLTTSSLEQWVKELQQFANDLRETTQLDSGFGKAFSEAMAEVFLKNLHLISVFEQLADYLLSIQKKKILLQNATDVIRFPEGGSLFKLKIEYTDLTLEYFPPLNVDITIRSDIAGEFPIYRLFEWI